MKFNYQEIERYCIELKTILDNLKEITDEFKSHANKIKKGDVWSCKKANKFYDLCKETFRTCEVTEEALKNAIIYITTCAENYEGAEKAIMAQIRASLE